MEPLNKKPHPDPDYLLNSSIDTEPLQVPSLEDKVSDIYVLVNQMQEQLNKLNPKNLMKEEILKRERAPDIYPQKVYSKFEKYFNIAQQRLELQLSSTFTPDVTQILEHAQSFTDLTECSFAPCELETHVFSCQNKREYQQDRFLATEINLKIPNQNVVKCPLFIVCDGHGDLGDKWAEYVSETLPSFLERKLKAFNLEGLSILGVKNAIRDACLDIDEFRPKELDKEIGGTTLIFALRIHSFLYIGNVGDSRAMLLDGDNIFQLSIDAHGNESVYQKGLIKRGAIVKNNRVCLVSTVRAFGNHALITSKNIKALSAKPKTLMIDLSDFKSPVLVLSSDGPYEALTPTIILQLVQKATQAEIGFSSVPKIIAGAASKFGALDNLTVMMTKLYQK